MRRLEVAELVLLAAAASALAATLILLVCWGRLHRSNSKRRPPELPLSQDQPTAKMTSQSRQLLAVLVRLMLCSGRRRQRARVEPSSPAAEEPASPGPVASWRERWFGPASRALYTIDEEDEEDGDSEERQEEPPETPFYTPASSPARLMMNCSHSDVASC